MDKNNTISPILNEQVKTVLIRQKGATVDNPEWHVLAMQLHELSTMCRQLAKQEKELKAKLIELSEYTSRQNKDFLFERIERSGSYDYARIVKDFDVNLAFYRKDPVTVWKLSKI